MKKLLCLFVFLAACTSCNWHPLSPRIDRSEAADSVFKIEETITVSLVPYCEEKFGPDGMADCLKENGETHELSWTGTAWIAEWFGGRTRLLTAGHLCTTTPAYHYEEHGISVDDDGEIGMVPIVSTKYRLFAVDGTEHDVTRVLKDSDDDDHDYCELEADGIIGAPLPLADSDPTVGQRCYYTGAPGGLWGGGLAVTGDMNYDGRGNMLNEKYESLYFTGLAAAGASGSPIICDGRVAGLLIEQSNYFEGVFSAVPYDVLRDVLDELDPWKGK
ncbi:MAG TPA: trypsin-like peptidase domain-containing protein [Isosphaeraceae bacterium]|nr:trypsin-like peptidase domain-containing protein [Isosphaeraceae bacterium]